MSCCDISGAIDLTDKKREHGENLRLAAVQLDDGLYQNDFTITDMHCAGCLRKLEDHFSRQAGVHSARANLSLKRFSVIWKDGETTPERLEKAIEGLGFSPQAFDLSAVSDQQDAVGTSLLVAVGVAGFSAMNIMLLSVSVWAGSDAQTTQLFHLISGLIAIPAVAISGRPFFNAAYKALRGGRLNMEVPISLAVLLALCLSIYESLTGGPEAYFDAAVSLLFFLLIGRYLDHLMRRRARTGVEQLSKLAAKGASVVQPDGRVHYLPLAEIKRGDTIRIKAGERLPLDGRLLSGQADFDRSFVTGESAPAVLSAGEPIEAGSLNLSQVIDVQVLNDQDTSFIAEIIRLMAAAEGGRSRYIQIADRMAALYAPAVHLLALVTFVGWLLFSNATWQEALYTAITVLIITCPCALGLAVPVAHVVAATRLLRHGILMKDGSALERMAEIDTVMFDKTGTLTSGTPAVCNVAGNLSLVGLAGALAAHSSHPMARSIEGFAKEDAALVNPLQNIHEVMGYGIEAQVGGVICRLGKAEWVCELSDRPCPTAPGVFCAMRGMEPVVFTIEETLRNDARSSIEALTALGVRVGILSGDRERAVTKIADQLNISLSVANCLPGDKVAFLNDTAAAGHKVLMVGDGLNDAAALSAGHVAMAPASACDIGRLAADFVFIHESLRAVPVAVILARRTAAIVRQNFGLALLYNCFAVPLAMAGYVTPLIAALAMSASSMIVIANSMRLKLDGKKITADVSSMKPEKLRVKPI